MNIIVNGQSFTLQPNAKLSEIIDQLNLNNQRFAVEVNGQIITRSQHVNYLLQDNDRVEIVIAVGGG